MRVRLPLAFAIAAVAAGAASAQSGEPVHEHYATGAVPVSHEIYATLPKLKRHRAFLPRSVDLTLQFPEPGAQGSLPNCTAWASTYAARSFLAGEAAGHRLSLGDALSPTYVSNSLLPPGSPCYHPMPLVDVLNFLKNQGTVPMSVFPARESCVAIDPVLKERALTYRIDDWRAVDREGADWRTPLVLDDVKGSLMRNVPIVFAMPITQSFYDFKGSGVFHSDEPPSGRDYHAMALIGYDEDRQAFRIINSWGKGWGDHGYGWIDYAVFKRWAGEAYALESNDKKPHEPLRSAREEMEAEIGAGHCGFIGRGTEAGHPTLTGFLGEQGSLDKLRAASLAAQPDLRFKVAFHPWPQCEAETTLTQALATSGTTLEVQTDAGALRAGDPVSMIAGDKFGIAATTTAERPYLSIIYLQADGSAVQLYRGQPSPDAHGRRGVVLGTSGPTAIRFEVAPPFGNEILIAIASEQPLFGSELEGYATERQFLTGLRAHLGRAAPGSVSATVLRLKTTQ